LEVPPDRLAHDRFEFPLVVGDGAEKGRFATVLADGGGDNGAVAVMDRSGTQRQAGLHQFVAR
jgi:hypothetical protein